MLKKTACCSVVEESSVGVHQSDALFVAGIDHNLISSRAGRRCDEVNATL